MAKSIQVEGLPSRGTLIVKDPPKPLQTLLGILLIAVIVLVGLAWRGGYRTVSVRITCPPPASSPAAAGGGARGVPHPVANQRQSQATC